MWASFNRFEIQMTKDQAESVSHPGPCDSDVACLCRLPKIKRQLRKISDETLADELREYGAWDEDELKDRSDNEMRIIWIAGCNIAEESFMRSKK